jgi:non-homologous end joining protein Ku
MGLIERKAAGEDVVTPVSEAPKPTKAPDLMAALEESLAAVRGEELGKGAAKAKAKAKVSANGARPKATTKRKPAAKRKPKAKSGR